MTADVAGSRFPTPLRAVLALLAVVLAVVLIAKLVRPTPGPEPLDSLAAYVGTHGKLEPLAPAAGRFFGIPGESIVFTTCSVVSDNGRTRSIGVHVRPELHFIDILLINAPNVDGANFYLTSTAGKLIESAYIDTEPHKIDDAQQRFEHELGFWQLWQRENVTHEAR